MNILRKALKFAQEKHRGQLDDSGQAYIIHPLQVVTILESVTTDENLLAAGYLHDVIEDCGVSYDKLEKTFNRDIADLVYEVTKEKPTDRSKSSYFPRLKTQRGIMLKLADRLSNVSRMDSWSEDKKNWYLESTKFWRSEQ